MITRTALGDCYCIGAEPKGLVFRRDPFKCTLEPEVQDPLRKARIHSWLYECPYTGSMSIGFIRATGSQ